MSSIVAVDHDRIITLIEQLFEEALPSIFTGFEEPHGADQLVARNFRDITTRQLFTLKCLCLGRDSHRFVSEFIYDHLSLDTLRLMQRIVEARAPLPSAIECNQAVLVVAIGYVAYYFSTPLRAYLREHLCAENVAYCSSLSIQSSRDRTLCHRSVSLQRASGGTYNFSGLAAFRHLL